MAKDKSVSKNLDPLEAVAVAAEAPEGLSVNDDFEHVPGAASLEAAVAPEPVKPVVPPAEPVLPAPGAVVPAKKAPSYQVLRPITISWGNAMLKLVDGDIISDESYGDGAVEKMKQSGVSFSDAPVLVVDSKG